MDARLMNLESKVAFQDDLLETLNSIVAKQQQEIEMLQGQVQMLYDQLRSLAPSNIAQGDAVDERPPHY